MFAHCHAMISHHLTNERSKLAYHNGNSSTSDVTRVSEGTCIITVDEAIDYVIGTSFKLMLLGVMSG